MALPSERPGDEPYFDQLVKEVGGSDGNEKFGGQSHRERELLDHYRRLHPEQIPPNARLIEVHETPGGNVPMVCLKIAIQGGPPWWVHVAHVRLLTPASRL